MCVFDSAEGPYQPTIDGCGPDGAERQGKGPGSSLIEAGTVGADEAGLACYLETATQKNIDFYAKRGFEITGQAPGENITASGMARAPRSAWVRVFDNGIARSSIYGPKLGIVENAVLLGLCVH